MRILPITNPAELSEVAETILENAMRDPQAARLVEALLSDPEVTKVQLFSTAFAMGASTAMSAWMQGNLIQVASTVEPHGTS